MRCLYSRFKRYPNSVTKVLQTLLRYLDRRKRPKTGLRPKALSNDYLAIKRRLVHGPAEIGCVVESLLPKDRRFEKQKLSFTPDLSGGESEEFSPWSVVG